MKDEPIDVEGVLAEVGGVRPAPESTRRALARAEAALAREISMAQRQERRWVLPMSIAAALIVAAGLTASLMPSRASAAEMLATTIKANEEYKGWVHLKHGNDVTDYLHWNTETRISATRMENAITHEVGYWFANPQTGTEYRYNSKRSEIRIGFLSPDWLMRDQETPVQFSTLIGQLRTIVGADAVTIKQSTEGGLERFDIAIAQSKPEKERLPEAFDEGVGSFGRPSTVWVDPKTKLINKVTAGKQEIYLTYGAPEITSIQDLGAPKDAKVVDNRPAAEVMAAVRRVQERLAKPLPDGVLVQVTTCDGNDCPTGLKVYGRRGANWALRSYPLIVPGNTKAREGVALPAHWQSEGAEELFRRLVATMPEYERGGDGVKAWDGQIDAKTGEKFITWGQYDMDESGKTALKSEGKATGWQEVTGNRAKTYENIGSPTHWFYPDKIGAAYSTDNHLDLITSPDRPGQVGFRALFPDNAPGTLRFMTQEWIDPAHEDRAVRFETLSFLQSNVRQIQYRTVKQFGEYATLPAPDGRSYPTLWTETTYDAAGNVQGGSTVTEVHFFPGRRMPEVPKKASMQLNP
jgi:hypothetical protein